MAYGGQSAPLSRCDAAARGAHPGREGRRHSAGAHPRRARHAAEGRSPTKHDWERLSSSWRRELDERIATLEAIRGRLTTCIGCGCLSLQTCGLLNPGDEAAGLGPGARYLEQPSTR